jgi:DNA-binding NtrC family response regulator
VALLARRLAVLHGEASLKASHLPARMVPVVEASGAPDTKAAPARAEPEPIEFPALLAALRTSQGNVAQAAIVLGISRQRAYRLMQGQAVDLEALRKQGDEPEP